ncbi:MAG: LPS export ABC transporter periplasmic protein LptC, partial [Microcystaceae cyanobacterium]
MLSFSPVCLGLRGFAGGFLLVTVLLALTGCEPPDPSILRPQPQNTPPPTSKLTLNKATLEQANAQGQNLWKLQVQEAVYSPDRKKAELTKLKGDLYENGKVVLKVSADRGSLEDDGALIVLRDNIVAFDPRNKAVLRGQELQWRPKDSFLLSPQPLKGSHTELEVTAQQGRYDTKKQELTLFGKIDGLSPKKQLTVKAEQILWDIPKSKISSDKKMTFARYQGKEITEQAITQKAELYLKKKQVLIKDNIEFKSLKPSLQVAGKELDWRYEDRTVESKQPLEILDYQNLVT